jgi:para-aminobenzoate synthetase component I
MLNQLNQLGQNKIPFLFVIDFEVKNFYIAPLDELDPQILFSINGFSNLTPTHYAKNKIPHHFQLKKKQSVSQNIQPPLSVLSKK